MSRGPREYKVTHKVVESDAITSFYLEPTDGRSVPAFFPGQFLTVDLKSNTGELVRRTYSLSCGTDVQNSYRISVKREPDGIGSRILHDTVQEGDRLSIHDPTGDFVLDSTSTRPVVLLSGGVGLTPLVSMLHALADEGERDVFFVHACDDGRVHALGEEVRMLASRSDRVTVHVCYRNPGDEDVAGRDYDSQGLVSKEILQRLLPIDDYDVYLCGPTVFMQAMYDLLTDLGVAENRIAYEYFGSGAPLAPSSQSKAIKEEPKMKGTAPASMADGLPVVTFANSGVSTVWDDSCSSLLELAEAQGLSPDFSCRVGVCNTCECNVREGELRYAEEPLEKPEPGRALICCSVPVSDIVLEV